jgi:DNA polymerase-3 subunit chi
LGEVYFYHMTRTPLEATLPMLLAKALEAGWRVSVRGSDEARLDWLDQKLWLGADDGFLPHGRVGGPHDADQPVLLTSSPEVTNAAACLMAVDGAEVGPDEVTAHKRVCVIFDGNDVAALETARNQWRTLTDAGCAAKYWSQESGSWAMKAESTGKSD